MNYYVKRPDLLKINGETPFVLVRGPKELKGGRLEYLLFDLTCIAEPNEWQFGLAPFPTVQVCEKKKKRRSGRKKKAVSKSIRHRFISNFGPVCFRCLQKFSADKLTMDHILPVFLGGKTELSNLQLLCRTCNNDKACQTVDYRYNIKPLSDSDPKFIESLGYDFGFEIYFRRL